MPRSEKSHRKGDPFPQLEKGKLRLYSMRFCPYAQRTRLLLAHKKIAYETVNVSLSTEEKPDWFIDRNPLGLVPVIEIDDRVVFESAICNDYLDTVYPEDRLNPTDPYRLAQDQILLARFSKVISNYYTILRTQDSEAFTGLKDALRVYEETIGDRGEFFGGENVCMLDFLIWPYFERIPVLNEMFSTDVMPESEFPKLSAWTQKMMNVPAVRECYFPPESHKVFYDTYKTGKLNYDIGLD